MAKVYSFKDVSGAFAHPLGGGFKLSGKIGMGQIVITMATEQSAHDLAADGSIMVSAIAGDNGQISFEVQQMSDFHSFLLAWYNLIKTAKDNGDVSNFANATITVRSITDGSLHILTGVSPSKLPDKSYAAQGQKINWSLLAADIQSTTA